jgi:hypothetical protein
VGWWTLSRAARSDRYLHNAVRRGLLAGAAWGLAIWVLWHGGEWTDGRYHRREPLRIFLLKGPFGPAVRRDLDWLFFSRPHGFTASHAATTLNAIGRLLSWHSLPAFAVKFAVISLLFGLPGSSRSARRRSG